MDSATSARWCLGIEIGGTKLQLGLGHGNGTIRALERRSVQPAHAGEGIRAQIVEAFSKLIARANVERTEIAAIGIGFGGPVDAKQGIVKLSHQIEGWNDFPLTDWVRRTLIVHHVILQNDSDTAALGEARFGAGKGLSPVLYVNSGSGIGGGLVIDGKIYAGSGHGAVEIGHLWMVDRDPNGYEAGPLILERIASGWAIGEAGKELAELERERKWESGSILGLAGGDPRRVTAALVAESARRDDGGSATAILRRATFAMGSALAHAITLLGPRRVVLGGGVSLMDDDLWLNPIRKVVDERVFPPFRGTFDIVTASLGEEVVLHGALALAADSLLDGED